MTATFTINGKPYTVDLGTLPADITLNTFIREHAGLTGTKFMCQEGGCGVCVCVVRSKQPATGELRTWAVNSCLTLLNSCTDWEIITTEGLGNKRVGYHAIQKRLAKMNGTQCGYCTPGFVMNMYGLLESKGGKVTMAEVEDSFGGNICRCTGYRPILDAMKSFATDSNIAVPAECLDIEDLNGKTCPKTGSPCAGSCKAAVPRAAVRFDDGATWVWPQTLEEVFHVLGQLKPQERYMLVAGNTAHGVYRRPHDIAAFIDVNGVPELFQHRINGQELVLGGNLSLSEAMNVFVEAARRPGFEYCQQLWKHFDLIANVPVRNTGTLAGNLTIKHEHADFPSDIFVVFEALDVQVTVNTSAFVRQTLSLASYLKTNMRGKVLTSFVLKPYPKEQYIFESYKIMPRAQNAHAYVNAAFLVGLNRATSKVLSARLCFGGINPQYSHAINVEQFIVGKSFVDAQVAEQALAALHGSLKPNAVLPDPSPEYRQKLATGLFYKFLLAHAPLNVLPKQLHSGGSILERPLSSGKHIYEKPDAKSMPVHEPTTKLEGLIQTSGEATYANDLPVQPNQVWVAFVTAKRVGATVIDFDDSEALNLPGVVAFLSAKDIPSDNRISGNDPFFFPEKQPLFNDGPIKYYNEPVGIIVAETNALAERAAELVKLSYSDSGTVQVLATMQDVLNSACADRVHHKVISPIKELTVAKGDYDVKGTGQMDCGLQYHFFMEPQTTVAVPFEGGMYVHSSTQWMDLVQGVVANFLGVQHNEVQVRTRRIGGGYGGKATNSTVAACAASLAAYRLNRPARFVQSMESMMNSLGKRWPFHSDYEFHAKSDGKIVAIRNTFHHDAGSTQNEAPSAHAHMLAKNCYMFTDNYKLDGYHVVTDSPSNISCRAPGSIEGIAMIENVIEHIAFATGVDPADVRTANFIPGHKIVEMQPRFIASTQYRQRKQQVAAFNAQNRWRKRGLGLSVMEYHVGYFGQFPATVAVYHGDGTVIISHGGIEMGQGMNTKIAQVAAHALNLPMEMVRIEGSDTVNGANSMVTGGSIGSETVCFAVRKCCATILERLAPIKEELKDADWAKLVATAYSRNMNLIASDDCKQGEMQPYTVCGLCLTEVEVDLLTGNYLVSRVDILEDTGVSLNPNVDIGQIEGAYMMGLGFWTSEQLVVDRKTGELKTNRSWNYKPPGAKDVPIDFRVEFLPQSPNQAGFMGSKATGEPAICLSVAVVFALQEALQSARNDAGLPKQWVTLTAPMTPEHVLLNAGVELKMMRLH